MRILPIALFLLSSLASAEETSKFIHVRYVEGHVDITVAQRRYATFQEVGDPTNTFTVRIFRPSQEIDSTNTYNILRLLSWFPCEKSERVPDGNVQSYFTPSGELSFRVPKADPPKNLKDWRLDTLKLNKQAKQDSTGQPATSPVSKSQGSDKPQPESEGRSR